MRTFEPKNSKHYHYEFIVNSIRIQRSSRLTNREDAKSEMTRHRDCLVKGTVFVPSWKKLAEPEPVSVPAIPAAGPSIDTLTEFKGTFMAWVRSVRENPKTIQFYQTCYTRLCSMIGNVPLNEIDEPKIEMLKLRLLEDLTRTTVNRHLATLRKALRYAALDLLKFDRVPRIRLYADEAGREYTFSDDDYRRWLEIAPEALRSASILARECGICRGELLALRKDKVVLHDYADNDGLWGTISVVRGLKRKARKRPLSITREMAEVLREHVLAL